MEQRKGLAGSLAAWVSAGIGAYGAPPPGRGRAAPLDDPNAKKARPGGRLRALLRGNYYYNVPGLAGAVVYVCLGLLLGCCLTGAFMHLEMERSQGRLLQRIAVMKDRLDTAKVLLNRAEDTILTLESKRAVAAGEAREKGTASAEFAKMHKDEVLAHSSTKLHLAEVKQHLKKAQGELTKVQAADDAWEAFHNDHVASAIRFEGQASIPNVQIPGTKKGQKAFEGYRVTKRVFGGRPTGKVKGRAS